MALTGRSLTGYGLYLLAALMWGLNGSVSKGLLDTGISTMRLSQFRVTFAWLILFVFIAIARRSSLRIHSRREFGILALYGLLGVTMTQWLYFVAIHLLPVGVALIIEYTAPLMVAVWVKFAWSHHVPRMTWLGLMVALSGLVMITEAWDGFTLDGVGVAAALGAAAALALYFLAGEKALHTDPPRDSLSLTMWGFTFATAFWAIVQPWWSFPWEYLTGDYAFTESLVLPRPLLAVTMVIVGTVLPFWIGLSAMNHITSQQASATGMTEPVFASIFAWILLGELLSGWQIIGGVVTLGGVLIAEMARR